MVKEAGRPTSACNSRMCRERSAAAAALSSAEENGAGPTDITARAAVDDKAVQGVKREDSSALAFSRGTDTKNGAKSLRGGRREG
jgi:hypothetical protein